MIRPRLASDAFEKTYGLDVQQGMVVYKDDDDIKVWSTTGGLSTLRANQRVAGIGDWLDFVTL